MTYEFYDEGWRYCDVCNAGFTDFGEDQEEYGDLGPFHIGGYCPVGHSSKPGIIEDRTSVKYNGRLKVSGFYNNKYLTMSLSGVRVS